MRHVCSVSPFPFPYPFLLFRIYTELPKSFVWCCHILASQNQSVLLCALLLDHHVQLERCGLSLLWRGSRLRSASRRNVASRRSAARGGGSSRSLRDLDELNVRHTRKVTLGAARRDPLLSLSSSPFTIASTPLSRWLRR